MVPSAHGDEWTPSSSHPTPLALGRFGSVRFGLGIRAWLGTPGGDTINLVSCRRYRFGGNGVYCFMILQSTIPYYNLSGAFVFLFYDGLLLWCFMFVCFLFESLFLYLPLRLFFHLLSLVRDTFI